MIITLEETKQWLRIDGEDDDVLLNSLINSAELYLKNATGKQFDNTNELAKLICLVLVVDWYENREFVGKADNVRHTINSNVRHTINSILLQLSYGGEANETSTT